MNGKSCIHLLLPDDSYYKEMLYFIFLLCARGVQGTEAKYVPLSSVILSLCIVHVLCSTIYYPDETQRSK